IESGASTPPSTHPPLNTEDDDGPLSSTPDVVAMLPQLWRQRRTLQWTIATLRYVESCRFGVLASAVPDVDAAALRPLPRRRLSSVQSPPPPSRPSAASARLTALAHDVRVLNAEVAFAIREYYKYKQVHPTVDLHFELDEAALLVKGPTFDLLRLQLQQVEGTVAHFQDQSGTLSIQLHTMSAANLMPQTPLPDLVVPVDRNQQAKADFVDAGGKATPAMPQHLEEMRGFELKLHSLVYTDKTCTLSELVLRVRRDILLDVLSQVGRNFNNIGIFLKERLDISRWAGFDMNNPLKSLSMSSGAADMPPSAVHKKPSQVVFSLELKPDKSAKLNPIKKAKSRFGFLKQKDKQSH
ncbi:hypothetical protein DYB34_011848, partial [Aphanomyces astaci]